MAILGTGAFMAQLSNFVFVIMIARAFGSGFLGQYSMSMAISALAAVFVSFGTLQMLVRDIGRNTSDGGDLLRVLFPLQVGLAIIALVAVTTIGHATGFRHDELSVLAMIAGYQILVRLSNILLSETKGRQHMMVAAFVRAGTPAMVLATSAVLLSLSGTAVVTIAAMPISAFVFFVVSAVSAIRLGGPLHAQWNSGAIIHALRQTAPFFLIQLLATAYDRIGIVILGVLATQSVVGEFAAGERIIAALGVIVIVLTSAALPALSHLAATDSARLIRMASRLIRLSWLVSLPMTTGLILFSDDIIRIIFGESYLSSALVLKIASLLMVLRALRAVLDPLAIATGQQSTVAKARAVALAILLVTAPVFIGFIDAVGLAAAMVTAEAGLVLILVFRLAAIERLPPLLRPAINVGIACLLMFVVGTLSGGLAPAYSILLTTLTGIAGMGLFGAITNADFQLLRSLFRDKHIPVNEDM